MKRCNVCNAVYENYLNYCPTCNSELELISNNYNNSSSFHQIDINENVRANSYIETERTDEYIFEQINGSFSTINGAVAEVNTQQYYQSKLTKMLRSCFAGEPYQLSHTSHENNIRIEEHTMRRYPENALDITVYGSMRSVFATGDDITVRARRRGNRYIARQIYNHTTNSRVNIQGNIPASLVRIAVLLLIILTVMAINVVLSINYMALISTIIATLFPIVIIGAVGWYIIRLFRRKA